jgi:Ca-activated chloride channel homolog
VRLVPSAWLVAGIVLSGALVVGQEPPISSGRTFRSGVELITVAATVLDENGRLVTGLPQSDFEIFEDGLPVPITQFTNERVPIGLGLLLDSSDSMYGRRLDEARRAVERFLFELLDSSDQFFVVAFNHEPRLLTTWTTGPEAVRSRLARVWPTGGTAIYDAVLSAVPLLQSRTRTRGAILLISDGADTASDASPRDVRSAMLRTDAFVYAIAVDAPAKQPINTRVNPWTLREITDDSGGRTEIVRDTSELIDATTRIADELNSQYLMGYNSSRGADGEYHSIRVRIRTPGHRVRARRGYIADPLFLSRPLK